MSRFAAFHDPLEAPAAPAREAVLDGAVYGSRVKINRAVVASVTDLTYDTRQLVVRCENGSEPLAAAAGQYATLLPEGLDKPRSYSFARAPGAEAPGEHSFFVRKVPDGKFSSWLFDADCVGQAITISGPLGKFTLDPSHKPMLCVAGGSGMSAIYALLEQACIDQVPRDAYFLYGAREPRDLYMLDELQELGKRWHPDHRFEFVPVLSGEPTAMHHWEGARGFVTDYMRRAYLDEGKVKPGNVVAYFCGPPPMIDLGVKDLRAFGVADADIRYDKFEDATSPAPAIDNAKCVLCDECLLVKPMESCIVEVALPPGNGAPSDYRRIEPEATSGLYYNALYIDESECIRCYACVDACPADAIDPGNDRTPRLLRNPPGG